ncbi:MAG: hypothetical protein LBS86_03840 [Treponema sp.]|nr:hypothetical protein [Treponema sp.]
MNDKGGLVKADGRSAPDEARWTMCAVRYMVVCRAETRSLSRSKGRMTGGSSGQSLRQRSLHFGKLSNRLSKRPA